MGKRTLSNSELKLLTLSFFELSKEDIVEEADIGGKTVLIVNRVPIGVQFEGVWYPTLKGIRTPLKKIQVDAGAIPFVLKGADVMRPGITVIDSAIAKSEAVLVVDPNGKPLGVGLALFDGASMQAMPKGKVIKNLHAIHDEIWNYEYK